MSTTPDLDVSITVPDGWFRTTMAGATLALQAHHDGQPPTAAVFARPALERLTLREEADRLVAASRGLPFHPLTVVERPIGDRPALLAAGLRQHARLGVQFQTLAVTRAAGRTFVVTGLCARADAPVYGAVLRDITHSLRIQEP